MRTFQIGKGDKEHYRDFYFQQYGELGSVKPFWKKKRKKGKARSGRKGKHLKCWITCKVKNILSNLTDIARKGKNSSGNKSKIGI